MRFNMTGRLGRFNGETRRLGPPPHEREIRVLRPFCTIKSVANCKAKAFLHYLIIHTRWGRIPAPTEHAIGNAPAPARRRKLAASAEVGFHRASSAPAGSSD